jgi:hypothetical protein
MEERPPRRPPRDEEITIRALDGGRFEVKCLDQFSYRVQWNTGAVETMTFHEHHGRRHFGLCSISFATSAVQPVWWVAPRPAPSSPSKYS